MTRISRKEAERARVLDACRSSGMSASAFAKQIGIPKGTLYNWLSKARHGQSTVRVAKVVAEVAEPETLERPQTSSTITIERGDLRVHVAPGFDPKQLGAVLDVIESRTREAQR